MSHKVIHVSMGLIASGVLALLILRAREKTLDQLTNQSLALIHLEILRQIKAVDWAYYGQTFQTIGAKYPVIETPSIHMKSLIYRAR